MDSGDRGFKECTLNESQEVKTRNVEILFDKELGQHTLLFETVGIYCEEMVVI